MAFDLSKSIKSASSQAVGSKAGNGFSLSQSISQPAQTSSGFDLTTLEGLENLAIAKGIEPKKEKEKLSFLQRLGRGLSAFEPINALYEAQYEGKNFVTTYLSDIFTEAGSAITGKELRKENQKKTFKDILVKQGMKDREGKIDFVDVAGFFGDVLTDPTTYPSLGLTKALGSGAKLAGKGGLAVSRKIAPRITGAAEAGAKAAQEALGKGFVPGFGGTKYAKNLSADIPEELSSFADEAVAIGNKEDFAKVFTAEDLSGRDPVKFFEEVTVEQPLFDKVSEYRNRVMDIRTETGKKYYEMFNKLDEPIKEDLVDGLVTLRKSFGKKREEMLKGKLDGVKMKLLNTMTPEEVASGKFAELLNKSEKEAFENVTKQLVKEFNAVAPENIFKDLETIKFFNKTLLPELKATQKLTSDMTGMATDMLMDYYFPMIKKDTKRSLTNAMRVGREGYLKRYKGILDKEDVISDAPEAYARRAFDLQKDGLTRKTLQDFVTMYGKPKSSFTDVDDALANGYRLVKEKGMYGKDVGYLKENDYRIVKELYDPSFQALDDMAKALGYDQMTGLFKKAVTGLFPSFHVRNFISGAMQNYQVIGPAALRPDNIATGMKLTKEVLSKDPKNLDEVIEFSDTLKIPIRDLVQKYQDYFGVSSQYLSDFGWEEMEKLGKNANKYNPMEYARLVGNTIETQQKLVAIAAAIRKGHSVDDAFKLAERAGFDYSKITPFEKHIMRRLIPFYTFSRKNLELQLRTLAENPQRIAAITKFGRSAGTPQGLTEDEKDMPDWMRNRITIDFGKSEFGLPQVISGLGIPLEETADLLDDGLLGVLSRLNPNVKVPLERAVGMDFFRERDIKDVYSADEYSKLPEPIKNYLDIKPLEKPVYENGEPTGEMKTTYVGDPDKLHILRNLFTSRGFNYLHTLFGENELTQNARIIKSLTGGRTYEIDQKEIDFFENRDKMRDLLDLLKRYDVVKTFERPYIPKEKQ